MWPDRDRVSLISVGVDVQTARGTTWAALDGSNLPLGGGVIDTQDQESMVAAQLLRELHALCSTRKIAVGIDAPRRPLDELRKFSWSRKRGWQDCEGKAGRHCEVILKSTGLANPQWTPLERDAPAWMRLGFALFRLLTDAGYQALEVFPSASYRMLRYSAARITVDLGILGAAPKDMLDAYLAAYTVGEFMSGRGCEVGGGDGLGTIILPRRLSPGFPPTIMRWPEDR